MKFSDSLSRKGMTAAAAMLLLLGASSCHGRHIGDAQPSGDTVEVAVEEVSDSLRRNVSEAAAQPPLPADSVEVRLSEGSDSSALSPEQLNALIERLN